MNKTRLHAAMLVLCAWAATAGAAEMTSAERDSLRAEAKDAFGRADYEAMAKAFQPLASAALAACDTAGAGSSRLARAFDEGLDDCLGLGHAYQLAGEWASAVAAYQSALHLAEAARKALPDAPVYSEKAGETPEVRARREQLMSADTQNHIRRCCALIRLVGCLQREELKDPEAAAATFATVAAYSPLLSQPVAELRSAYLGRVRGFLKNEIAGRDSAFEFLSIYPSRVLEELATAQERRGQIREAIETLNRVNLTRPLHRIVQIRADVASVGRLVQKLPAGQPVPLTPMLLVLGPAAPSRTLKMDDPETLAESCGWWGARDYDYWQFAFSPSPGQEFAKIGFACDFEQTDLRLGGAFKCSLHAPAQGFGAVDVGAINWPRGKPPGREVLAQAFDIPPGAGLVYIQVGIAQGHFKVHSITAKAEFRAAEELAQRPPGVAPKADVWMQSECLPPGGVLTRNGEPIGAGTALSGMAAGHYAFEYSLPGNPWTARCEADFVPGGRYGLFFNLDSPFRWTLTNLRRLSVDPPGRCALARLPNGRWLAAYGAYGRKIMLSASEDGVKWDTPWPLPHGSVFDAVEPSLHVDERGTLWLAYFSNRLYWPPMLGNGQRLWLASSRDGRAWSPPRPITLRMDGRVLLPFWRDFDQFGSSAGGAAQMVRSPDGRQGIFWRNYAAWADSPGDLRELTLTDLGNATVVLDPCLAVGAAGRLHMVYTSSAQGVSYSTSPDGRRWSPPVLLVADRATTLATPQLILDGTRAALIYAKNNGTWLCRGQVEPTPQFDPPIKIAHHVIPLNGARPFVAPDGEVSLLVGGDTVWLLRAARNTLTRAVQKF